MVASKKTDWMQSLPVHFSALFAIFVSLSSWSWRRWPDPVIDFGRELYVPWQLSLGKILYVDVAYFNGPLSPYFNSVLFRVFGEGLMVLAWVNMLFLGLITLLIYFIILQVVADRFISFVASACFLLLFGFNQMFVGGANQNFICPYSHEITHGFLLSLMALAAIFQYLRTERSIFLATGSLCLGLLFLTKPEVFLAGVGGVAVLLSGFFIQSKSKGKLLLIGVTSFFIPILLAFFLLSSRMPAFSAAQGVLGSWKNVSNSEITNSQFYRSVLGTDDIVGNLQKLLLWSLYLSTMFFLFALFDIWNTRSFKISHKLLLFLLPLGMYAFYMTFSPQEIVENAARSLPLVILGTLFFLLFCSPDEIGGTRRRAGLAFSTFSFVLLLKIILHVKTFEYGAFLSGPALLIVVVWLLKWLPPYIKRYGGEGRFFSGVSLIFLIYYCGLHLFGTHLNFKNKSFIVGEGVDAFFAEKKGFFVQRAVQWLSSNTNEQSTLLVLPEGVMINYLARRRNPSPYINFMPPELAMFGESTITKSLEQARPEYLIFQNKYAIEYGTPFFGKGYGAEIYHWAATHYRVFAAYGAVPFEGTEPGLQLLQEDNAPFTGPITRKPAHSE